MNGILTTLFVANHSPLIGWAFMAGSVMLFALLLIWVLYPRTRKKSSRDELSQGKLFRP